MVGARLDLGRRTVTSVEAGRCSCERLLERIRSSAMLTHDLIVKLEPSQPSSVCHSLHLSPRISGAENLQHQLPARRVWLQTPTQLHRTHPVPLRSSEADRPRATALASDGYELVARRRCDSCRCGTGSCVGQCGIGALTATHTRLARNTRNTWQKLFTSSPKRAR